jgi:putative YphP/YqiW family bacilliredoxin
MQVMMYDERFVTPMRRELTDAGFEEWRTSADVDANIARPGTTLVVVNSVCGCSARMARPGVLHALEHADVRPDHLATVFAGQDADATARARSYFTGYPPSSPSISILRDGKLVYMMERWQIEGRHPQAIGADLVAAFQEHCGGTKAV